MYHWAKNEYDPNEDRRYLTYRGLVFPLWKGRLSSDEIKSGKTFFAFFGGRALTERAIIYNVNLMIERGVYAPPQAA